MARQANNFQMQFKVEFKRISEDEVPAWRAGLLLLLQILREEKRLLASEDGDGSVDVDSNSNDGGVRVALFPLEDALERKRVAQARSIHAWFIGHDGSVYRVALVSRRS